MKRVLVTGANGFIGKALCRTLLAEGWHVTAAVRNRASNKFNGAIKILETGNIAEKTDWDKELEGFDMVVHLAAKVHVMSDSDPDPLAAYRVVNVRGTRNLAQGAARAGIKRFVFMSSVKVNGEESTKRYCEDDEPRPQDAYGISKMEGEIQLKQTCQSCAMEFVIIRPPLVYGPEVKANFLALMDVVYRKIPLPFAGVRNLRSFIYIGNLVDCIYRSMRHPAAAGQTYLVSDGKDISTPDLIRLIAASLKKPCFLFPFPKWFMCKAGILISKEAAANRLLGSLTVDISKIKKDLGWMPPFTIESGLQDTADWYKQR